MNQGALDPNGSVETFVTADNTGAYTIAHVCPGMKKIQASAAGYATADRQAVQVEQGKPLAGIDFALNEGARDQRPGHGDRRHRRSRAPS